MLLSHDRGFLSRDRKGADVLRATAATASRAGDTEADSLPSMTTNPSSEGDTTATASDAAGVSPRSTSGWLIAMHRFFEVSLGIAVGLALSAVWPERPAAGIAHARKRKP
jgi:hypothetical protein